MRLIIDQECVFNAINQRCFRGFSDSDDTKIQIIDFANKNLSNGTPHSSNYEALSDCANEICKQIDNIKPTNSRFEYAGVSDIPFVFLAAHRLKTQGIQLNDIGLWHNFREPNSQPKGWRLLEDGERTKSNAVLSDPKRYAAISPPSAVKNGCVMTFASSFIIRYDELSGIPIGEYPIYMFEARSMHRDVISNKEIAIWYAEQLKTHIQVLKVSEVHLALSVSVPMAFCLAYTLLQPTYLPSITIYHYDNLSETKRPWGIKFDNYGYEIVLRT